MYVCIYTHIYLLIFSSLFGVDCVDLFSSLIFRDCISPFNTCYKAGVVVLMSLKVCFSEKLFISPSILNEILARYSTLGCRFFPFSTLNISCYSHLSCSVSAKKSAVKHMGLNSYITCCFPLTAFNILFLCLIFLSVISMYLGIFLLGFILYGTLHLLDLIGYFLFNYNPLKNFLLQFLFLFFFWDTYNSTVDTFDIVPEVRETILRSSHSFYFILLFRRYFHQFIFQLTASFFVFRYSALNSF